MSSGPKPGMVSSTTTQSASASAAAASAALSATTASTSLSKPSSNSVRNGDGGITITMHVADLSGTALQNALTSTKSQSVVYLFRFLNGFQPAGATAAWSPAGWTFGFDDFTTKSAESGQPDPTAEKIIVWNQTKTIKGKANQDAGTIVLSVPLEYLRAQSGPTGAGQVPEEVEATAGSRLFDGTAFTLGNSFTAAQTVQSYLYPVDNSPSMDFLVGEVPAKGKPTKPNTTPNKPTKPQTPDQPQAQPQRPPLATTGAEEALSWVALVLVVVALAAYGVRRRKSA